MKMINKNFVRLAVLISVIFISGCSGKPIQLNNTGWSSADNKVDLNKVDFSKWRGVSAEATGFQLLLFIPININDRHERALRILRSQAGSDFLTDITVEESWTYGFIGTFYTTKLEAKVYPYKK